MKKYTKKNHLEEFEFGLYRAYDFVREQPGYVYPKELAKLEQALLDLTKAYEEIQEKYFRKDWDKEGDED